MRNILSRIGIGVSVFGLIGCGPQTANMGGTQGTVSGRSYTNVTAAQLKQLLGQKDFFFVNVHVPYAGELAQTDAFIPYTDIEQNIAKLPADKNAKIVLYCSSGHMSGIAANTLIKLGYANIWNLDGGMAAWQNAGYSLIQNKQ